MCLRFSCAFNYLTLGNSKQSLRKMFLSNALNDLQMNYNSSISLVIMC